MTRRRDPVTPELREYVLRRDGWCVIGLLVESGAISGVGPCRGAYGVPLDRNLVLRWPSLGGYLTLHHVHRRGGGKAGRRAPSDRFHLVAVCAGHHLLDMTATRSDVLDAIDDYLEAIEGRPTEGRPWERVRRVRAAEVDSADRIKGGQA